MNAENEQPSAEEWKELYKAAGEFKKIECWDWMSDSDIFGIQNPQTGEIGYCCIMGQLGEHFALAVYLGTEGLDGYLKIQSGYIGSDPLDFLHIQKCLMASFEDKAYLEKPDLDIIKNLGLKYSRNESWPLFRNYTPGYHPWYLTRDEVVFLTAALKQATSVALRFNENPSLLEPPGDNQYLVRVFSNGAWEDKWLEPAPLQKTQIPLIDIDESRMEKIRNKIPERSGIWEIDFFYSPDGVQEKKDKRPHYPQIILWANHHNGFLFKFHVMHSLSDIAEQTLSLAEKMNSLPEKIMVKKEEAFAALEPVAKKLGISIKKSGKLREIDCARQFMSLPMDKVLENLGSLDEKKISKAIDELKMLSEEDKSGFFDELQRDLKKRKQKISDA